MRRFLLLLFGIFLFVTDASAQVVDMRAYSRRRGFKAYTVKRDKVRRSAGQNARTPQSAGDASQKALPDAQDGGGIRQTGAKIFLEEDENKVLKFDAANPEFDKLTKKQQDNVMSRISIKEE